MLPRGQRRTGSGGLRVALPARPRGMAGTGASGRARSPVVAGGDAAAGVVMHGVGATVGGSAAVRVAVVATDARRLAFPSGPT